MNGMDCSILGAQVLNHMRHKNRDDEIMAGTTGKMSYRYNMSLFWPFYDM